MAPNNDDNTRIVKDKEQKKKKKNTNNINIKSKRMQKIVIVSSVSILILVAVTGFSILALQSIDASEKTAHRFLNNRKEYTLIAQDAELEIAPGKKVKTWTFNGTVPGPTLRFTEGDNVTIHFINKSPLAHTIHFHGNHDERNDGVIPQILPNQNYTYNFIADPAGALMYHCHAYPTSLHIRMGMYGSLIIDPAEPMKPAREFSIVLGEFDPDNQDNFVAKYYPVNGYTDQYMGENALRVNQEELVRFYVINMGTTIPYSFHLHSTIFKVYQSGLPSNPPIDAQTIEIGPGNAVIIEAKWKWPGRYLFHSHGIQEERGNMGEVIVASQAARTGNNTNNGSAGVKIIDNSADRSISMIDWQYDLQKRLQQPSIISFAGDKPQNDKSHITHTDHKDNSDFVQNSSKTASPPDSTAVRIVQGSWDNKQKENYVLKDIMIDSGTKIKWTNEDNIVHTVTSKDNTLFDSSIIAAGEEWEYIFENKGVYEYYCTLHPWMEGKVIVK